MAAQCRGGNLAPDHTLVAALARWDEVESFMGIVEQKIAHLKAIVRSSQTDEVEPQDDSGY